MRFPEKTMLAAAAMAGAALAIPGTAQAQNFGLSIGDGGIGFSLSTGGYCDQWGCPQDYWSYPVYYGPVYWDGDWYRGPVYFRRRDGDYWYWIHGGWHRNERPHYRPDWAHYGPPLGRAYYEHHGFRMHDHWRDHGWRHDHGDHWRGGDHWRRDHGDHWRHDHGDHWRGGDHGDHYHHARYGDHGDHWRGGDRHGDHGGHHGDRGSHHGGDHHGDHHDHHDHGDHHGH